MGSITSIFDSFDLSKIVPDLSTFLGRLQLIAALAAMAGPLVLLGFGIWYYFFPLKEANRKAGFRTFFGMGSVEAWQYAQRLAGIVWGCLGAVLTVATIILCLTFGSKNAMQVAQTTIICMICQAVLAFLGWLAVTILVSLRYDKSGNRRK